MSIEQGERWQTTRGKINEILNNRRGFETRADMVTAWAALDAVEKAAVADGIVWNAGGALYERDSTATAIPDLGGWNPAGNTAALSAFGAAGDTVISATGTLTSGTDDTTAIQAAADWANAVRGRKLVGDDGAVYRVTSAITGTGDLRIDLGSARIFSTADARILDWSATLFGPYDLATDYTAGDLSIDLTGDPLPVAPLKGAVIKIVSDGVDPGNRDLGSLTNQNRIGEWFVVGSGSTTTNIVLDRPLRFTRAISPTSTAGDEAEVDSYTTTLAARVVYADPDEVFEFIGGVVGHEYGHDASWTGDAIHVTGFTRPRVLTHVQKCYGSGVRTFGTIDADVSGCTFSDFRSDRGYGVSDAGRNTLATDLRGKNIRHIYSSSGTTMAAGETDPAVIIGTGRVVGAKFGGHGEAGVFAHWDTHHESEGATMVDAISEGSGLWSHAARGRGIDIVRPKSRNCTNGIFVFTEYDDGDPDEDYFNAGKAQGDFTSARVIDPDIECDEAPLAIFNCTAKMAGAGKFSAADHCMIHNNGASVIIEGHHEFTARAGTVSHSRTGCIELDEANSNNGGALVTTLIIEGTVLIDARNASAATVYGLNLAANCQVIVRGRLKFNLPTGSTLQTGSGTLTVEGDGVVEHYNGTTLQDVIVAPGAAKTPEMFKAEGDGTTDDTAAFQAALTSLTANGGGRLVGQPGKNYVIEDTVFIRGDDITIDMTGTAVTVNNFDVPIFSLADPDDATIAPDRVEFIGGVYTQTETQVDINGTAFYGAQPEDYKVAALIHRGKGNGKTLTIRGVEANNFVNFVSDYGDWQFPDTTLTGTLIVRDVKIDGCNFGFWSPGWARLDIDGVHNTDTAFVQVSGGTTLPPHVVYSTTRGIGAANYAIRNIFDKTSVNGTTVKLKGVTGGTVENVHGDGVPGIVELLSCVNVTGDGHILENQSNDPALSETQSAFIMRGCEHCHLEGYVEQDASGAHSFVAAEDENNNLNVGCSVRLKVRKTNDTFVSYVDDDENGTTVWIDHLWIATAATSGVHTTQRNDAGYTPDGTKCIIGAIEMETPGSLLLAFVESGATNTVIEYDPLLSNATAHTLSDSGTGTTFAKRVLQTDGTWTLTISDASGNDSATTKTANYVRCGDSVSLSFSYLGNIDTTGLTAGNEVRVSLPYAASSSVQDQMLPISVRNMGSLNGTPDHLFLKVGAGASYGVLTGIAYTGGENAQLVSNISSGVTDIIVLAGSYIAEPV